MNWASLDNATLDHWRKLGRFRARHVALARGAHTKLAEAPYTFARISADDRVVIALGAAAASSIKVGEVFADGAAVRDAYTGAVAKVEGGAVKVSPHPTGVVLLEAAP